MLLAYVLTSKGSGVRLTASLPPGHCRPCRCVRRVLSVAGRHPGFPFVPVERKLGPSERTTPNHHCSQLQ